MKTYIHYKERETTELLISTNINEPEYKLGMEIECDCFYEVLKHMTSVNIISKAFQVFQSFHISVQENIVTNMNVSTFKHSFLERMDIVKKFARENYTLRFINSDNTVTLYARMSFRNP